MISKGGELTNIEADQCLDKKSYFLNHCISCISAVTKAVNLDFQRHRGKRCRELNHTGTSEGCHNVIAHASRADMA